MATTGWPSATGWFTLTLALTWTAAGLILFLLGWLSLPRGPRAEPPTPSSGKGSVGLRMLGGMILAVGATIAGAYLLAHWTGWDAAGTSGAILLGILGYGWLRRDSLPDATSAIHWLEAGLATVWGWAVVLVTRGVHELAHFLALGYGWVGAELPGARAWGLSTLSDAWALRGYGLVNLTALLLTVAVGGFAG